MNSIFQKYKWLKYVVGAFIIALGVLVIILACLNTGKVPAIINIVVASASMIMGLVLLFSVLLSETHKLFTVTMVVSSLLITFGILLLVARFGISFVIDPKILVYLIGIFSITFGVIALGKGVSLIVFKEKVSWIALLFLLAVAAITLGILALCYVGQLVTAAYIILGVALVTIGVIYIVFAIIADNKKEKAN